jgi:transcriptional regulator with GAF, ATPase, and Fis domain
VYDAQPVFSADSIVEGRSPRMRAVFDFVKVIADSESNVLIVGETGTGKETGANLSPRSSRRRRRPFVPVSCAILTETLIESELFGHERGAFTGAIKDHPGRFEAADGGTIFLDDIDDVPRSVQVKLLRVVQERTIERVGGTRAIPVDVRVITGSKRSLKQLADEGQFREDLFYRLNVVPLWLPPLRERREDIPLLIDHFLEQFTRNNGSSVHHISPDAIKLLSEYSWPGNVRELENVIERLVVTGRTDVVGAEDLPMEIRVHQGIGVRPKRERRRTVADDLYKKLVEDRESFWTAVYPLYMQREITRGNMRDLVRKGLEEARGNYKIVARMFNMEPRDYKRFLNFLRKHECQLPFKEYR